MCGPTPLQAFDAPEMNEDDGEDDEEMRMRMKYHKKNKNKGSSDNLRKTKVCSKCEGAR